MPRFLTADPGEQMDLPRRGGLSPSVHVFEREAIDAINAALAAQRPLLVRGEPGTGKSQLARAAAERLGRVFLSKVIDARTEARDLFWSFDAVARLAEAQLLGAAGKLRRAKLRAELREQRFLTPGPLWWALDWDTAKDQARYVNTSIPAQPEGWKKSDGTVVLLDEIDKADSAVPNGLLEALGNGEFPVPGSSAVSATAETKPLVIVTTNEERALPDAFLRRCLVLQLTLPAIPETNEPPTALLDWLLARGVAHFPNCPDAVLRKAAEQLVEDRRKLLARRLSAPGQAEYLDLVRAVLEVSRSTAHTTPLELIDRLAVFALRKHADEVDV